MDSEYTTFFRKKYPYIDTIYLQMWEGRAKELLVHLLYPCKSKIEQKDKDYAYENYYFWIMAAIQEFIERNGATSLVGYSENGINMSFDNAQISQALKNEIIPFGSIK